MTAWWTETDYCDGQETYLAIDVEMDIVELLLGHEHTGASDDDAIIVAALLEAGAPEWIRDAPGYAEAGCLTNPASWGVYRVTVEAEVSRC